MDNDDSILSWYLGTGGQRPGVLRVPYDGQHAMSLLDLPQGQSVYAIDLDFHNGLLAAGTRTGRVVVATLPMKEGQEPRVLQSLEQGAPVLSVRFVGRGRLASTDTAGRCLLWRPLEDPHNPSALESDGSIVCSVLALPSEERLLGLSAMGRLLWWNLEDGRVLRSMRCPVPPRKLALVRLVHWPWTNAVAYPGTEGRLVLCELDGMQLQTSKANRGSFFAVFVVGRNLCTVGTDDRLLKAWQEVASVPAWQCNAPAGVIGGQEAGQEKGHILLITHDGQAAIHTLRSGQLRLQQTLAESNGRTVSSAAWRARLEVLQKRRTAKAQELCLRIKECIAAGQSDGLDALHLQLVGMGCQTVSLTLRARQAAGEKDALGELRARHSLAQMLPADDPLAAGPLCRYGQMLQDAWLLHDALAVHVSVKSLPNHKAVHEWIEKTAKAMEADDWVVQADRPIPSLVESATIVGRPFSGRWVLSVLGAVPFPEGRIAAGVLVQKYEQVRSEDGRSGLPAAGDWPLRWLSRQMPRSIDTVLLAGSADPTTEGAELAVQVLHDGFQTIFVEHLLLHVGRPRKGESPQDHNRRIVGVLERIGRPEHVGPWLLAVRRALNVALQRLHTEAVCRRREG